MDPRNNRLGADRYPGLDAGQDDGTQSDGSTEWGARPSTSATGFLRDAALKILVKPVLH
jgi:hypothetical protein